MVINMNETRLTTIAQIEEFLRNAVIEFLPWGDDAERYAHISRVLKDVKPDTQDPGRQACGSAI